MICYKSYYRIQRGIWQAEIYTHPGVKSKQIRKKELAFLGAVCYYMKAVYQQTQARRCFSYGKVPVL
jgi:hypothetical protein